MPISKAKYKIKKTGVPITEINRNIGEKPQQRKPLFVPVEQQATIIVLEQILTEIKEFREDVKLRLRLR